MKNKDSVRISVRLSEEEKEKLERSAEICGLSQSEFVRQLCKSKTPKLRRGTVLCLSEKTE